MLKKLVLATALSFALSASAFAADEVKSDVKTATTSIAVVNIPLIMSELPQAKEVQSNMQKEFGPRKAELDKIEAEGKKLQAELQKANEQKATEIQRKLASLEAEFKLKGQALQEDAQKKEREAEQKLVRLVQTAIDRIAKERGINIVVRGEAVVFASDSVDISKEVIARASKLKPAKKENN